MDASDGASVTEPPYPTLVQSSNTDGPRFALSVGAMVSTGRYQVGERIGLGGMGEVLAARDVLIGRDVAIKRLHGDLDDLKLERFMREACIQGRLDHPAIVPVHELAIDENGVPYFVMKKLRGTTLARIVADSDPAKYSRQRLLRAFVEICLAVEFAHTRGYIHRDLKPDNIVLGEFGEVYVIDWGIAKLIGSADAEPATPVGAVAPGTSDGKTVGTPGYMAPEQASASRDLDVRVDIYALGCILFEILAGERLHPGGLDGLHSALRGVDARPSVRAPARDIPPELDAICVFATAIDRESRPASARALAELVERFLDGDRDVELRKRLAGECVEAARESFEASDDTASRRSAMRLAGRALALDPTHVSAAELVGRLMLDPPRELPSEVSATLAEEHVHVGQRAARLGMYAHGAYIAMLLALLDDGYSSPVYPALFAGLIIANLALLLVWRRAKTPPSSIPLLLATGGMVALLARMFSPFYVAPGIAAIYAMSLSLGSLRVERTWATVVVMVSAVLLPLGAEEIGLLSPSYSASTTGITFLSPGLGRGEVNIGVLVAYTIALVSAAGFMAAAVRRADGRVREKVHLQAWQLRQLVPIKPARES